MKTDAYAHPDLVKVDEIVTTVFPDLQCVVPTTPIPGVYYRVYFYEGPDEMDEMADITTVPRVSAMYDAAKRTVVIGEFDGDSPIPRWVTPEPMSMLEVQEAGGAFVIGIRSTE